MAQKKINDILRELSKKHNLPLNVIEEIYESQWKKLKEEASSLEFKTIKLPNWGKYIASNKKLSQRKEYYDKKRDELNGNTKDN